MQWDKERELMVSAAALEHLKSVYGAWNSNKASTAQPWFDIMADDVRFRSIADGAQKMEFTRPDYNKDQVKSYFDELALDWQMLFYNVRCYLVSGDSVAMVGECSWRHRKTEKVVHT